LTDPGPGSFSTPVRKAISIDVFIKDAQEQVDAGQGACFCLEEIAKTAMGVGHPTGTGTYREQGRQTGCLE
jgi:hypothetical protein